MAVEVVPSPNAHSAAVGAGAEVFTKLIGLPTHTVVGIVKFAFTSPITTVLGLVIVAAQPVLLVTVSVTLKLPTVLY